MISLVRKVIIDAEILAIINSVIDANRELVLIVGLRGNSLPQTARYVGSRKIFEQV